MKILLVEDDSMIGESLAKALKLGGYTVDWVHDGESADAALADHDYAMMLLDLGLPLRSGIDVLKAQRAAGNPIPVLILTARDEPSEVALGLDCGADDYMVKPFHLVELEARIRALLRRKTNQPAPEKIHGALSLNPVTRQVKLGDETILLSQREFAIMQALLENPEAILSRAQLEEALYGWNEEVESNAVEVHIHHLRRKLGPQAIRNVRGLGYMIGAL